MSIEKEIQMLKYNIKILTMIINSDRYPFFMQILDHQITEDETRVLIAILRAMNSRLKNKVSTEPYDEISINFIKIQKDDAKKLFSLYQIPFTAVYSDSIPRYNEFASYCSQFLPSSVNPKYLILSLKMQSIYVELCNHLLADMK
ncbi:MAG: DUF1878 family protein [Firmicutes bacterium]|nr:DUF1878 family protein [Bacillota bacterium]